MAEAYGLNSGRGENRQNVNAAATGSAGSDTQELMDKIMNVNQRHGSLQRVQGSRGSTQSDMIMNEN